MSDELGKAVLKNRFLYHTPSPEVAAKLSEMRNKFNELAAYVLDVCPAGDMLESAINKIEEASMWAVKSVVIDCPAADPSDPVPR